MDKSFEKKYSINVARMGLGKHRESFQLETDFFSRFESSSVKQGQVEVDLVMEKYETHLDTKFSMKGVVSLDCDRCSEPYLHALVSDYRIIYSFDPELDFDGYEVMHTSEEESELSMVQELYDLLNLAVPIRKVPDPAVHLCAPEVLELLGLDMEGNPVQEDEDEAEKPIDPRWEKLRQLKNKMD